MLHLLRLVSQSRYCLVQRSQNKLHNLCTYRNLSFGEAESLAVVLVGVREIGGWFSRSFGVQALKSSGSTGRDRR